MFNTGHRKVSVGLMDSMSDRELNPRARDIVVENSRLERRMGISYHQLYGSRAVITIEMNEKGIWWLLARVDDI
jgi:hypothetical protein